MTVHGRHEFSWKEGKLYRNGKVVAELQNVDVGQYKIKFANGDLSADHYNKTWAKNNAITILVDELNAQETHREAP